jgi:hypothetical protein
VPIAEVNVMKNLLIGLLALYATMALVACGEKAVDASTSSDAGSGQTAATPQVPGGTPYDCQKFSLTLAKGWTASPLNLGMVNVLPEGKVSPGLYFKFEGEGNAAGTAEESITKMVKDYKGSPMESTTIDGVEFKSTTYTYNRLVQTMHIAFRNGTKVTITIEGEGAKDNADIKAMLASVKFK